MAGPCSVWASRKKRKALFLLTNRPKPSKISIMNETEIAWTDFSWNPASGCSPISAGCAYCYAHKLAEDKRGTLAFPNGFGLTVRPHKLKEPSKRRKRSLIFVNSTSDLFWREYPAGYREDVFDAIWACPQHVFQLLTKRPEAMKEHSQRRAYPENLWAGVSIENKETAWRADVLRDVKAAHRFISVEPLLGPLELNLEGIEWLIIGGESGNHLMRPEVQRIRGLAIRENGRWKPNPERIEWVRVLEKRARERGIPVFFKQWGGARPNSAGCELDGRTVKQYPPEMQL